MGSHSASAVRGSDSRAWEVVRPLRCGGATGATRDPATRKSDGLGRSAHGGPVRGGAGYPSATAQGDPSAVARQSAVCRHTWRLRLRPRMLQLVRIEAHRLQDGEEHLQVVGGRLKQQRRLLGRQQRVQEHLSDEEHEACTRTSRYYNGWLGSAAGRS